MSIADNEPSGGGLRQRSEEPTCVEEAPVAKKPRQQQRLPEAPAVEVPAAEESVAEEPPAKKRQKLPGRKLQRQKRSLRRRTPQWKILLGRKDSAHGRNPRRRKSKRQKRTATAPSEKQEQ